MYEFTQFPKIARYSREMIATEKLDGTNACVRVINLTDLPVEEIPNIPEWCYRVPVVAEDGSTTLYGLMFGSRSKWIYPAHLSGVKSSDNFGFAKWCVEHAEDLVKLGEGTHYGEWWGMGINRAYDLKEKRFSLFNVGRWRSQHEVDTPFPELHPGEEVLPACLHTVPVIWSGLLETGYFSAVPVLMDAFAWHGSYASPGFMRPEGIILYHKASRTLFKKTFEKDFTGKEQEQAA